MLETFKEMFRPPLAPIEVPHSIDLVFAAAATGIGKPSDALACVYFGTCGLSENAPPLFALGWTITTLGPWALADWRDEVRRQIAQLSRETGAFGREAVLIIEPAGGGRVLAAQRFPGLTVAHFSRDDEHPDIDQNVIPFADRARAARTWMDMGAAQLTRPAVEKVALFRNRELNHLTSQLSSAGNGSDPEKVGALAAAFWAGVHECYLSPHLRERAINMRRPGLLKRILPRRRTDAEIAREKRLAAYPALRADYEARKAALIARTRLKLGDPHWLPRSNIALAEVGPPPRNPFAAVPVRGELMHSDD